MRWSVALLIALVVSAATAAEDEESCRNEKSVRAQVEALTRAQSESVAAAVDRIEGTGRQLLALRSYVRSAPSIADRWSWTQAQIDVYRESDEYRDLLAEIEKVRAQFEADNPGFTLYANTEVRSLDVQIARWNENKGVGAVAADLYAAACGVNSAKLEPLRKFLVDWQPDSPSPLAAPGLSQHGRARAIDFQVEQGKRLIAGADTSQIADTWGAQGWARKLNAAIRKASPKFQGPLTMPNEPWHYEYRP
jgi:hypothetical protein